MDPRFTLRIAALAVFALPGPLAAGPVAAAPTGGDEEEEVDRRKGDGSIPLGATAKGMIVQGFYNTIRFEAVAGTTLRLELRTFHRKGEPLAELRGPDRGVLAEFRPAEDDPRRLLLDEFTLTETGEHSVRFGFLKEENGRYELLTDATFPSGGTHRVRVPAGGEATLPIEGMLGRELARCEFLLPEGADVAVTLVRPYGGEDDLSKHTRRTTFGRRVKITDLPIDSNARLEFRFADATGDGAEFDVEIEYDNPPLSRKRIRI